MRPHLVILGACSLVVVTRVATLPEVQAQLLRPHNEHPFPFEFHPAKIGAEVTIPGLKPDSSSKQDDLLVVCGECMSCAVNAVDPGTIDTGKYGKVILVFSTPYQDIPRPFKSLGSSVVVIGDPENKIFKAIDAGSTPHYYLLTHDLKIKEDQKTFTEKPSFLIRRQQ